MSRRKSSWEVQTVYMPKGEDQPPVQRMIRQREAFDIAFFLDGVGDRRRDSVQEDNELIQHLILLW